MRKLSVLCTSVLLLAAAQLWAAGAPRKSFSKAVPSELLAPKVPETGQAAMLWPGLDLAGQIGRLAGGTSQEAVWSAVRAPGLKSAAPANARTECYLPDGWTFVPLALATGRPQAPRAARLPQRWPDDRDYVAGWYARRVTLAPRPGERLVARFDQVALFCVLYVNGVECGRHLGAYTPFEIDITRAARSGENLLALYVHDASGAVGKDKLYNQVADWKPQENKPYAGGVWGPVRLERRPEVYVGDVFVKTSTRRHELTLVCELENAGAAPQTATIDFAVLDWPDGAAVPLAIPARQVSLTPGKTATLTVTVPWSNPRLWSPDHPNLYVVRATLTKAYDPAGHADCHETRFGFREFWCDGQRFMLNGVPIRLFGESHYGSGRSVASTDPLTGRALNRHAFLALKERYRANAFRVHAQILSGNVALGADEAGCLLINQSSIWSTAAWRYLHGGESFLANTRREFAEWVRRDRNCPSVVIWDVENEQIRMGEIHKPWAMRLDPFVRENDDTRPVEHSGAGWYDKDAQIIHLHDEEQFLDIIQRWHAQENRPLIMGEFWVGFQGGEWRPTSSPEFRSRAEYTFEEARLNEEELLQMRNYGVSGLMPFQIARVVPVIARDGKEPPGAKSYRSTWYGDKAAACAQAVHHGLQPLTAFFWPRNVSAAAGESVARELVVCNDSETSHNFTAEWSLDGAPPHKTQIRLAPGEQQRIAVSFAAPAKDFRLAARLLTEGTVEATDELAVRVADAKLLSPPALQRQVIVYEGGQSGAVEKLKQLGIAATASATVPADPQSTLWVIGPGASDAALNAQRPKIREYLEAGGRILCLPQEQAPRWSPVRVGFSSAARRSPPYYVAFGVPETTKDLFYSCYATIYAAGHPAFAGITASDLRLWSQRDGRVSDDALLWPAAAGGPASCAWRVLAGACRPELASLAEARVGRGTLVFCQAQVLQQDQTPEARLVLMNLLRYLDGGGWAAGPGHVGLAGALDAATASKLTGAPAAAFAGAAPERGDVLIATDGAVPAELEQWAAAGGTVLVLSAEVARRLPGYAVAGDAGLIHLGVRGQDHPLLWGVCSASFLGFDRPCIEGVLNKTPESAKVLLHGLSGRAAAVGGNRSEKGKQQLDMFNTAAGPVAVAQPRGKGTWIVTTMTPWRGRSLYDSELMTTLLANAGVEIPAAGQQSQVIPVLKTAPLKIDGRLDDWTSDVEDRNVSAYVHAKPIVLSAEDALPQPLAGDAQLSAIVYFLWDEKALYVAGAALGADAEKARVVIRLNGRQLSVGPLGPAAKAQLDGRAAAKLQIAGAILTRAEELIDARALDFGSVQSKGKLKVAPKVPGRTFELAVPWGELGGAKPPAPMRGMIRVERGDGVALQAPAAAKAADPATWLVLMLVP